MEYFIIWEVTSVGLKIVTHNDIISLYPSFAQAAEDRIQLKKLHPDNQYFIRVFKEPEIITALIN